MTFFIKKIFKSFLLAIVLPILPVQAEEPNSVEPVVILGGGVGSLTSALYLGRAGLSPLVIEGPNPGGLLTQSHAVQNWPGVMEIDGIQLTQNMREQAKANGARFVSEEVVGVDFSKRPFSITTRFVGYPKRERKIQAQSCIIAMGTQPNFLGVPGEQKYWGQGVTNCAVCDGAFYKDKVVGVVGGGDAAVLEALYLSNIAKEVNVFVRKSSLKAVEERRVGTLRQKNNVNFFFNTSVEEIQGGQEGVTGVIINKQGEKKPFKLDGVFLAIGSTPNSKLFQKQLKLDRRGYITLKNDQETTVKGVYAIGDIVDPVYKQAVSAAGDGAKAALQVQNYLSDLENKLVLKRVEANEEKIQAEVIEVSSIEQFHQELANSDVPVFVDFYATWCGPCRKVAPVIESSAVQLAGKVKFLKVNVDQLNDLSREYKIRAMPTVLFFDAQGVELDRKVGFDQICNLLESLQGS